MTDKSDSVSNGKKCNKNMSSQAGNKEFKNSNKIQNKTPSSPQNSFLSDAFVADLLSENVGPTHSNNKTCDNESFTTRKNQNNSNHQLNGNSELKDTSGNFEVSSDFKGPSCKGSLEKIDSEARLHKENSQDITVNFQGSSNLTGSSLMESVKKIDAGTSNQEENGQDIISKSGDSPDSVGVYCIDYGEKMDMESNNQDENQVENGNKSGKTSSLESLTEEAVKMHNEINKSKYRERESSSDDDSSDSFLHAMQREVHNSQPNKVYTMKTKGELDIDDLPPIEDLQITVKESEVEKLGTVYAIVKKLVVVKALKNLKALDVDSVLFLTPEKPLGEVFDVFGPVVEPMYTVRFNSEQQIVDAGVKLNSDIFYAPEKEDITNYVILDELKKQKGSDASWKDNNEPPEEYIDYSDDEQEKVAKQKRRAKNRPKPFDELESKPIIKDQPKVQNRPLQPSPSKQPNLIHHHYQTPKAPFRHPQPFVPQPQQKHSRNYQSPKPQVHAIQTIVSQPPKSRPPTIQPARLQLPQPFNSQTQQSGPSTSFGYQAPPPQSTYQFHQSPPSQPAGYSVQFHQSPPQPAGYAPQFHQSSPQPAGYAPQFHQSPTQPAGYAPQFHQAPPPQPAGYSPVYIQNQPVQPRSVAFQQPHVFGQMAHIGPVSPALQQPPVHFAPSVMSPPPLVSISPASPNFSYFSHKYVSAPSPPTHGHVQPPNTHFVQAQPASVPPRIRILAPLPPLTIQIPNNLRTPPPTMPGPAINGFNAVSSMQLPQNIGSYMHQPGSHPY